MKSPNVDSIESIVKVVTEALDRGSSVEIDGLGSFVPSEHGKFKFVGLSLPKVFITYVHEDWLAADRLYTDLAANGFDPWMDRRRLMPGQNWPRAIEDAMSVSNFVIACFSSRSVNKKGGFQAEIRYALDCAQQTPLDQVYLLPVRLDSCHIPNRIQREMQYVDLFPDWETGFHRILRIMRGAKT